MLCSHFSCENNLGLTHSIPWTSILIHRWLRLGTGPVYPSAVTASWDCGPVYSIHRWLCLGTVDQYTHPQVTDCGLGLWTSILIHRWLCLGTVDQYTDLQVTAPWDCVPVYSSRWLCLGTVDQYTHPQMIVPWDCGPVYSSTDDCALGLWTSILIHRWLCLGTMDQYTHPEMIVPWDCRPVYSSRDDWLFLGTMDQYTHPQMIVPWDYGPVYTSSTLVCILLLLIGFRVLFGSHYINTPTSIDDWTFSPHLSVDFVFKCVRDHEFLWWQVQGLSDILLSKPWTSLWTMIVMKMTMWPHSFCASCFIVSVLCIITIMSALCIVSICFYVFHQSACGKYNYLWHNYIIIFFFVLPTKRKPTLHLCITNIPTLLLKVSNQTFPHYFWEFQAIVWSRNRYMRYVLLWEYCCHTLFCTAGLARESSPEQQGKDVLSGQPL